MRVSMDENDKCHLGSSSPLDDYENFISPPEVAPSPRVFHIPTPRPRPGFFTGFFTGLSVTRFQPTSSINV